jgi:hypothetical protein
MKRFSTILLALAALGVAPQAGAVGAAPAPAVTAPPGLLIPVAGDCRAIGQQVAAQYGGTLADAQVQNRGGQNVCVGVVVVPPRDGERGKQIPFEVPM